ncbi:DUF6544 family protein [Devosia sp.]|uniref:DUF6544 family protein n=1 Tax=Devosia sp. TaxID=1871048 RepID=UPI003263C8E9
MNIPLIGIAVAVALLVLVQVVASRQFAGKIAGLRQSAVAEQGPVAGVRSVPPEIMVGFAERSGATVGGPSTMMARQNAEMRLAPDQPFFPLVATQLSGTRTPAFVWEATATMAKVVPLHIVDSYTGGRGLLEVKIAGSIQVAGGTGPDTDKGEMMRFLAELAWNPEAILNASGLSWRQIDMLTVEVSAPTSAGVARVRLLFDAEGDIVAIEADDRPFLVGGKSVPTRWIGRFGDYASFGRYRLPRHGEVAWVLPAGEFLYWRGDVAAFEPMR